MHVSVWALNNRFRSYLADNIIKRSRKTEICYITYAPRCRFVRRLRLWSTFNSVPVTLIDRRRRDSFARPPKYSLNRNFIKYQSTIIFNNLKHEIFVTIGFIPRISFVRPSNISIIDPSAACNTEEGRRGNYKKVAGRFFLPILEERACAFLGFCLKNGGKEREKEKRSSFRDKEYIPLQKDSSRGCTLKFI